MNTLITTNQHTPWVLISGATGGLGKAFAVECASRGWNLFLTDLRSAPLDVLANSLMRVYGVQVRHAAFDLTDLAARGALFGQLHSQNLRFMMLVNVAGLDFEGPFFERERQELCTILRLNIEGTVDLTRGLLELRDPFYTFRILNVSSLAAFYPMPVKATYAASKRFLLDFSIALGEEMRSLGVTVTALCPAGLPTTSETIAAIEAQGWMGQITTSDIGSVASGALDAALAGKSVYIPGWLNRALQFCGSLLPARWVAALVAARWRTAWQKRGAIQPEVS